MTEGRQGKQNEKDSPPFPPPHLPMAWEAWDSQRGQNCLGMESEVKDQGFSRWGNHRNLCSFPSPPCLSSPSPLLPPPPPPLLFCSLTPPHHTHTHVHMRTYTMLFLSFSLCTYHFPCPEHCLIRTSFWPLLKHYSFSKTFPEHLQAELDAFFYCVSIARNSHSVILPVCLSASPLRIRIPYGQRLCIVCFFIFSM